MTAAPVSSLRRLLREGTAQAHRRTEAVMERFDLSAPAGYAGFLAAHRDALAGLASACPNAFGGPLDPDALDAALSADLAALGADALTRPPAVPAGLEPVSVTYVIAGSSLGAKVLRRRLDRTWTGSGAAPTAYLTAPALANSWAGFVGLSDISYSPRQAERIVSDAVRVFEAYERAALARIED